ncbi:MAG: hypothetical protein PHI34_09080 [Acidobacteriota bacterium]|nr:hypothetical protein [Acidobacteriota bacterium]
MMKKLLSIGAAVGLMAAAAFSQTLSLNLRGGVGFATGGDVADGLRGIMDYYSAEYSSLTGKHAFPGLGLAAGGELLIHLSPRLALGLGSGYERHGRESIVTYEFDEADISETLHPVVRAIPVIASLHFSVPLKSKLKLDIHAGGGVYFATLDWTSIYDVSILGYSGTDEFSFQSSRMGFGAQAGLTLEWPISSRLAVCLDVTGRWARVSGLEGDWTETGSGDLWNFSENGKSTLYYYDWTYGGATYPQIAIQADLPEGSAISEARKARLDLTGLTATIGLKIRLF